MQKNLFTIAIPTYNRAKYLQECLLHITNQLNIQNQEIDIIVSDNCSTDNTQEVVEKFIQLGYTINYIKNEINKGADFNIAQCYQLAKTQFVLALGDDDYFLKNSIKTILEIIQNNKKCGVIHIHGLTNNKDKNLFTEYTNAINFIEKINYWITFISGNIINKKYCKSNDFSKFQGSSLNQIYVIFICLFNAPNNIYINKRMLDGGNDKSECSYDLFEVFGVNFNTILLEIECSFNLSWLCKKMNKPLLNTFYSEQILNRKRLKISLNKIPSNFYNIYKSYPAFWIYFIPIYYMPYKMGLNYFKTLQNIQKLFNKLTKK